ncbi:PAS domain S-box protein, partial [archaeon]
NLHRQVHDPDAGGSSSDGGSAAAAGVVQNDESRIATPSGVRTEANDGTSMASGSAVSSAATKPQTRMLPGLMQEVSNKGVIYTIVRALGVGAQGAARKVLHQYDPDVLMKVVTLFRQYEEIFPASAQLQCAIAVFQGFARANRYLERVHLQAAQARADPSALDVQFLCWARLHRLDSTDDESTDSKMTVAKRVEFELIQQQNQKLTLRVHVLVSDLWTVLQDKNPNLDRLSSLGLQINRLTSTIQGSHDKLLSMAPQSISVMREAARFFIEVANDPRRGRELLLDAEQIEDEQSRLRSAVTETDILLGAIVTDFDISGDGVAILRVSSKVESLGIIMSSNAAALKLLGFHSRELIGHDINTLVPEPIASVHRNFLVKYTEDGEETIVNTSRVYFMQHRAGYVLPASVWVRPAADEWAAVCEEINTPLSFIFFAGVEMGWRVTGVCKKAMAALNVDTQVMRSGSLSASSIIPQLQLSLRRLQDENGALIELQPLVDYADLAHAGQHSARSSDVNHMPSSTPLLLVHARQQVLRMPTLNTLVHIIRFRSASASEARRFRRDQELALAAAAAGGHPSGSGSGGSDAEPPLFSFDSVLPAHATGGGDISLCPIMRKSAAARGVNGIAPPNTVATAAAAKAVAPSGSTPHGLLASGSLDRPDSGGRAARTPITSPLHSVHQSGGGSSNPASCTPSFSVNSGVALHSATSPCTPQSSVGDDTPALPGTPNFGLTSPLHPFASREPSRRFSMEMPGGSRRVMWEQPATVTDAVVSVTDAGAGNAVKALASEQPMVVNAEDSDNEEANSSSLAGASGSSSDGGHGAPRPVLSPVHRPANSRELDTSTSLLAQPLDAKPAGVGAAGVSGAFDASINQPPRLGGMRPSMSVGGAGGGAAGVRASRAGSVDDDQQGGRPGSVHSKGSASSKSSVNDVLRRSVQVRSTRMERSLRLLHQAVLLLVIAVAIMNLTAVFVTSSLLRQLITNMALVSESGQRVQHLQDAMIDVSDQVLSQAGVYTPRAAWAAVLPHTRTAVAEFERLHQELYMQLDVAQADEVELYSRDNLRLEDLVPGTYVSRSNYSATYRNVSFANGGLEFIAKARLFMGLPEAAMLMTNPVVFWLNSNPNAVLLDAATRAVILSDGRSAHQAADICIADLIVIILSLSLLSSIALFIMAPAVCNVQRTKRNVFQVFLHVPSSVIRALRLMSTKRALQLKREQDGFDEDEDTQENAVYGTDAEFMGQQTPNLNRGESGAAAGSETDRGGARPSYNMMRSSSVNVNPLAEDDTGERELKAALNALANRRASVDIPAATSGVEGKYMLHRMTGTPATATPRRRLCGCCRKSPSTVPEMPLGFGRGKRHFQSRSSSGTSTFLVLAWPVLLCFAYYMYVHTRGVDLFWWVCVDSRAATCRCAHACLALPCSGVYFWRHQIVEYSKTARAETLFMTAVGTRVAHAAYTTKQAWAYCDPSWVTQKVAETRATVAFVDTTLVRPPSSRAHRTHTHLAGASLYVHTHMCMCALGCRTSCCTVTQA